MCDFSSKFQVKKSSFFPTQFMMRGHNAQFIKTDLFFNHSLFKILFYAHRSCMAFIKCFFLLTVKAFACRSRSSLQIFPGFLNNNGHK